MFRIQDKAMPDIQGIRRNFALVNLATVQVTNLPLQKPSGVRFDLMYKSGLKEALHTYIGYTSCIYKG